jgi:hypothetical protein
MMLVVDSDEGRHSMSSPSLRTAALQGGLGVALVSILSRRWCCSKKESLVDGPVLGGPILIVSGPDNCLTTNPIGYPHLTW